MTPSLDGTQLELAATGYLRDAGYERINGPAVVPDGEARYRHDCAQVVLFERWPQSCGTTPLPPSCSTRHIE